MQLLPLVVFLCEAVRGFSVVVDHDRNLTYQGRSTNGIEHFLNIRFGEDTSKRRFAHPRKFQYARGSTIEATTEGCACPQSKQSSGILSPAASISEDCLNLRVARVVNSTLHDNLPVMVWIHGGSDSIGHAYDKAYDPTGLLLGAQSTGSPVLYVAMNYRLKIFGFANTPALAREGSLNAGLLDQRLALEWVQENIAYFGGDPSRVTIFGESDGATGVGLQATAFGGAGRAPFQRCILQSGAPAADSGVSGNGTYVNTMSVADATSCAAKSEEETLLCLRQLPMESLLDATLTLEATLAKASMQDTFYPVVDGDFIPDAPSRLVRAGRFYKNVSTIVGFNYDDGSMFVPVSISSASDSTNFIRANWPNLNSTMVSALLDYYPASSFQEAGSVRNLTAEYLRCAGIYRDISFACPGIDFAHNVALWGSSCYMYELNETSFKDLYASVGTSYLGVSHFSDVPFVFKYADSLGQSDSIKRIETQMSRDWRHFVSTGSPSHMSLGSHSSTYWPKTFGESKVEATHLMLRVIGGPAEGVADLGKATSLKSEAALLRRCAFINSKEFYAQSQT